LVGPESDLRNLRSGLANVQRPRGFAVVLHGMWLFDIRQVHARRLDVSTGAMGGNGCKTGEEKKIVVGLFTVVGWPSQGRYEARSPCNLRAFFARAFGGGSALAGAGGGKIRAEGLDR